jgi:hypothetical protein
MKGHEKNREVFHSITSKSIEPLVSFEENRFHCLMLNKTNHPECEGVAELYKTQKHCDVVVIVDNKTFHGHSFVLSQSKLIAEKLDSNGYKHNSTLVIKEIDSHTFKHAMDIMYTGDCELDQNYNFEIWKSFVSSCQSLKMGPVLDYWLFQCFFEKDQSQKTKWKINPWEILVIAHESGRTILKADVFNTIQLDKEKFWIESEKINLNEIARKHPDLMIEIARTTSGIDKNIDETSFCIGTWESVMCNHIQNLFNNSIGDIVIVGYDYDPESTLEEQKMEYKVSKSLLSWKSEFFGIMFGDGNFLESRSNIVKLENVSNKILFLIFKHLYGCQVKFETVDTVLESIRIANALCLDSFRSLALSMLVDCPIHSLLYHLPNFL